MNIHEDNFKKLNVHWDKTEERLKEALIQNEERRKTGKGKMSIEKWIGNVLCKIGFHEVGYWRQAWDVYHTTTQPSPTRFEGECARCGKLCMEGK